MKSIRQIKNLLVQSGLIGDELKSEFHKQALVFSKYLIDEIYKGFDRTDFDYTDAAVCMGHLSEIFVYAARDEFYHDFAEHFQGEVYNASPDNLTAFCDWHDKNFKKVEETNTAPIVRDVKKISEENRGERMEHTIKVKNELPELLEAICNHKDCPDWLAFGIWDVFAAQNQTAIFTAEHWRATLAEIEADKN